MAAARSLIAEAFWLGVHFEEVRERRRKFEGMLTDLEDARRRLEAALRAAEERIR